MATEREVSANQSGKSTGLLTRIIWRRTGCQRRCSPAPLPLTRPILRSSRPRCRPPTGGFAQPYLRDSATVPPNLTVANTESVLRRHRSPRPFKRETQALPFTGKAKRRIRRRHRCRAANKRFTQTGRAITSTPVVADAAENPPLLPDELGMPAAAADPPSWRIHPRQELHVGLNSVRQRDGCPFSSQPADFRQLRPSRQRLSRRLATNSHLCLGISAGPRLLLSLQFRARDNDRVT